MDLVQKTASLVQKTTTEKGRLTELKAPGIDLDKGERVRRTGRVGIGGEVKFNAQERDEKMLEEEKYLSSLVAKLGEETRKFTLVWRCSGNRMHQIQERNYSPVEINHDATPRDLLGYLEANSIQPWENEVKRDRGVVGKKIDSEGKFLENQSHYLLHRDTAIIGKSKLSEFRRKLVPLIQEGKGVISRNESC